MVRVEGEWLRVKGSWLMIIIKDEKWICNDEGLR